MAKVQMNYVNRVAKQISTRGISKQNAEMLTKRREENNHEKETEKRHVAAAPMPKERNKTEQKKTICSRTRKCRIRPADDGHDTINWNKRRGNGSETNPKKGRGTICMDVYA